MASSPLSTDLAPSDTAAPAAAAGPAHARRYEYHVIYLVLSLVVLALAATMSVQGGTQVTLPFFDQPLPELCHMRRYFGVDCPGCGMTRCFISLAHGDVVAAWHYNAGGIVLFGLLVAQIPFRSLQIWRLAQGRDEWRFGMLSTWVSVALAVGIVLQWVWKAFYEALA